MSYEANTDLESTPAVVKRDSPFGHAVDGLNGLGSLLIFAVMLLMCADVLSRDLINKPIDGVAEMVAYSIIAIVFLHLPSTLRHGRMARADIFIDGFVAKRPRPGHLLKFVFSLTGAFMLAVVFYATYPNFMKAWTGKEFFGVEGVFTAPTWPVMLVVLIGSALTSIQYLLHAFAHLRAAAKGGINAGDEHA
jgi:TRAP-type mannitol/chloroaromatic compound transport system permease small subunit